MFVANSLASPKAEGAAGLPPDPAKIYTTNYPVYGSTDLAIPQWIISSTPIDPLAVSPVYDWVQARVKDIFSSNSAPGDVNTVLAAVKGYSIAVLPDGTMGQTAAQHAAQSQITLSPYYTVMRTDSANGAVCGNTVSKQFTNALLHEARHAYKNAQATLPGNDKDNDFLVNSIAVAPASIILDTTTPRTVCNEDTGATLSLAYHGDAVADSYGAPDNASYAFEMDAWVFGSSHDK